MLASSKISPRALDSLRLVAKSPRLLIIDHIGCDMRRHEHHLRRRPVISCIGATVAFVAEPISLGGDRLLRDRPGASINFSASIIGVANFVACYPRCYPRPH